MPYTSATTTSATPAKDLMAALGTALTGAGYQLVESYGSPSTSANWTAVCWGNGTYVAVATGTATAATSPDGITWTQRTLPATTNWNAVTYGGGQFVAVSSSASIAATSPDGITWTQRTMQNPATAITYGGGLYVTVASGGLLAQSSPDAITWTARTLPAASGWSYLAYGNGRFLAASASTTAGATSTDGITWTSRPNVYAGVGGLAFGAGVFVTLWPAGGTSTAAATSPDGTTWTLRSTPGSSPFSSLAYGPAGGFVALPSSLSQVAMSSPDGITWTARTAPAIAPWTAIAGGDSSYAAVTSNYAIGGSSPDGATWTRRTLTATSTSPTADVYRSPAGSNSSGRDWYLILRRAADNGLNMFYQVAEGYDAAAHLASGYGGQAQQVTPAPGSYLNPLPPGAPDTVHATSAFMQLVTTGFTWRASVTADRLILGTKPAATELGFYAGLYDDLTPAGVTGYPLVCAAMPQQANASWNIGNATVAPAGGFTREPLQNLPTALNFEARIHNGFQAVAGIVVSSNFTPMTSSAPLYGNPGTLSRAMIGTARPGAAAALGDLVRGLLKDCYTSTVSSVDGDTATVGGKTYVRLTGPTATFGFFVDQAL